MLYVYNVNRHAGGQTGRQADTFKKNTKKLETLNHLKCSVTYFIIHNNNNDYFVKPT